MTVPVTKLRLLLAIILATVISVNASASQYNKTVENVTFTLEDLDDGSVRIISAESQNDQGLSIYIDNKLFPQRLTKKSGMLSIGKIARKIVTIQGGKIPTSLVWKAKEKPKTTSVNATPSELQGPPQPVKPDKVNSGDSKSVRETSKTHEITPAKETARVQDKRTPEVAIKDPEIPSEMKQSGGNELYALDLLNEDPYFGQEAISNFTVKATDLSNGLVSSSDKAQFIKDNDLMSFLAETKSELESNKNLIPSITKELMRKANLSGSPNQSKISNLVQETLTSRLLQREEVYNSLQRQVDDLNIGSENKSKEDENGLNWGFIGLIILLLVIILALILFIRKKKSGAKKTSAPKPEKPAKPTKTASNITQPGVTNANGIVVTRRTSSTLKKQSLEDVIGNPMYLEIDASSFISDTAVRKIYIKNSCIKDVYNMYAEDLRNPENPKEDGCMVIGRWVHDPVTSTYDISMEEVILPGDDAIFKEYELNFGGKIKMRVADRLRRLRKDTDLQYDLVCWIHSHPGLGVFFSNSDDTVHHQLKQAQHPNFLIAFVIDILTPNQEMGIFTFRKGGTVNSKNELRKLHSLEEMYKWALESETASFDSSSCFNILQSAKTRIPPCFGVELNNSSIIDLTQILIGPETGIVGWAVGAAVENNGEKEYVVSSIVRFSNRPTTGKIGLVVKVSNFSLPTIQRLVWNERSGINFVIAFSTKTNAVTVIPVIGGEIINDENFYGEEKIDDLKTWTRRKR